MPGSDIGVFVVRVVECGARCVPGSRWFTFGVLRGNRSNDKLIRDNTGGVWRPVAEPRPVAGFTHLKLLSEEGESVGM